MTKKFLLKSVTIFTMSLFVSASFVSCKEEEKKPVEKVEVIKEEVSPYAELLEKTPVYKDSVYSIYITTISGKDKIVYLRDGSESDIRKESKFFLHIYPTDKTLLGKNKTGNLNYDFKNNAQLFTHSGNSYYVSETDLPELDIDKINTGQYGYKGDGSINWRLTKVLSAAPMQAIIDQNQDAAVLRIDQ